MGVLLSSLHRGHVRVAVGTVATTATIAATSIQSRDDSDVKYNSKISESNESIALSPRLPTIRPSLQLPRRIHSMHFYDHHPNQCTNTKSCRMSIENVTDGTPTSARMRRGTIHRASLEYVLNDTQTNELRSANNRASLS